MQFLILQREGNLLTLVLEPEDDELEPCFVVILPPEPMPLAA